jgi:hypothetical protein
VINRHSRAEAGRSLLASNSSSQSWAESSACFGPYKSFTAVKNADNSCCAIVVPSAQSGLRFFGGL